MAIPEKAWFVRAFCSDMVFWAPTVDDANPCTTSYNTLGLMVVAYILGRAGLYHQLHHG